MKKQKGFGILGIVLAIVIVSAVCFSGWYVWETNNNQENNQQVTTPEANSPTNNSNEKETIKDEVEKDSLATNWKRFESGQGAFSIKLPDGLDGSRDKLSDIFLFKYFNDTQGEAIVNDTDGFGTDGFSALTIYQSNTADIWNPTEIENLVEHEYVTATGIKGVKKSFNFPYRPPCEGVGCYLGEKQIVYDFKNDSKTIRVWYSRLVANDESKRIYGITEDSPDFTEQIDAMVKTLIIN